MSSLIQVLSVVVVMSNFRQNLRSQLTAIVEFTLHFQTAFQANNTILSGCIVGVSCSSMEIEKVGDSLSSENVLPWRSC